MLIYANWRENDGVDFFFFFFFFFCVNRSVSDSKRIRKNNGEKAQAKVVKCAKNKSWVPRNPPPPWSLKVFWSSQNGSFVFDQIFVCGTFMGVDYKSEKKI